MSVRPPPYSSWNHLCPMCNPISFDVSVNKYLHTSPIQWSHVAAMCQFHCQKSASRGASSITTINSTHYHKRSNVESTFSTIKRRFGGAVRSKSVAARTNEVLCKAIAHNLRVLVQSVFELGIEPLFWRIRRLHNKSSRGGSCWAKPV